MAQLGMAVPGIGAVASEGRGGVGLAQQRNTYRGFKKGGKAACVVVGPRKGGIEFREAVLVAAIDGIRVLSRFARAARIGRNGDDRKSLSDPALEARQHQAGLDKLMTEGRTGFRSDCQAKRIFQRTFARRQHCLVENVMADNFAPQEDKKFIDEI
ncbi:hypothetical protein [Rhizobium sp. Root482]|uniref:hypothetical protein n=1 Tax=Rhizobium sp. Root482 TaxID=1736543 RepID=UPI0012E339D4|nr:hypothetical protein [Rhizobium sp. Root482]